MASEPIAIVTTVTTVDSCSAYLGAKMLTCNCCATSRKKGNLCDMLPAFSWKKRNTGRCFSSSLLQSRGTNSQACSFVPSAASSQTSCR